MTSLNEYQKRSLLLGSLHIHKRMEEMEAHLARSAATSPFTDSVNDLSPTESRVIQDYFARIRTTMVASLQECGIPLEIHRTSLRWTLQCTVQFLSIAVAEFGPKNLKGYGPLTPAGEAQVIKIQEDLHRLIDRLSAYLRQGTGQDLSQRLARLEAAPASVATLQLLDRVLTRWRLVEFRPVLDTIVRRLEAPQFEIAVFGRVSSGKSSLLNHLAGMDVLPVGITPITAVPTRLVRGDPPAAVVYFAEMEPRSIGVEQLQEFASEEGNPGNRKHVTNLLVQLPSPRLREEVVLVDTPGMGSLALAGSAETLAYLPRCDLGIVLIDAASNLNQEDLGILRALYEAGVPAQVLLSKADLLIGVDRQRMVNYIREQLQRELGLDLPVHPVSTVGADEALLTRWFDQEIAPLLDRHRALAEASLQRKIAHLRESVVAVLQTLLARRQGGGPEGRKSTDVKVVQQLLDEAAVPIREAMTRVQDWTADVPALTAIILDEAAQAAVTPENKREGAGDGLIISVIQQVLVQRGRTAQELVKGLQQTLSLTLEGLRQKAALANADVSSVRDVVFSGLPVLDLDSLRDRCRFASPWWAPALPGLAVWAARRSLRKQVGPALRELVGLYDRQLRAWLKNSIAQLVNLYESQAEVFREQVRRLTMATDGADTGANIRELIADLQELQGTESSGQAMGNNQAPVAVTSHATKDNP